NEKTTVEYLIADPTKATAATPPGDSELVRYYEDHKDRYARGEGRSGLYVLFSPSDAAAGESVSEDDVAAAYERYKNTRYEIGEQRCAAHILVKVAEQAPADVVKKAETKA